MGIPAGDARAVYAFSMSLLKSRLFEMGMATVAMNSMLNKFDTDLLPDDPE